MTDVTIPPSPNTKIIVSASGFQYRVWTSSVRCHGCNSHPNNERICAKCVCGCSKHTGQYNSYFKEQGICDFCKLGPDPHLYTVLLRKYQPSPQSRATKKRHHVKLQKQRAKSRRQDLAKQIRFFTDVRSQSIDDDGGSMKSEDFDFHCCYHINCSGSVCEDDDT